MTLRALVTRPDEDAAPLAAALAERGVDVTLEPLLAIRPLPEAPIDLAGVQALLFTSANGVRSFAELAGGRALAGWRELPVFAVGNATAAAARNAGFAQVESAAGDVAALAKLVTERLDPKAGALFHAAGSAVAGDLAGLLEQAGFTLRREMLYEARPADQLSPATVTNLSNGWFDLVLFFSPRTAATFVALARAAGEGVVTGCGKAAALCLSPAVAAAAGELPWREVQAAARPELSALLELIDRELAARAESAGKEDGGATAANPSSEAAAATIEPPLRRRSRLGAIVVTAAATAVVVALAVDILWSWWSGPDPSLLKRVSTLERAQDATGTGLSIMKDDVGTMIGQMRDVRDRVAELASAAQNAPNGAAPDLAPLTKRLDALEQEIAALRGAAQQAAPTTPAGDLSALSERIAALESKLSALQGQSTAAASAADATGVSEKIAALEARVAALQSQPAANGGTVDTAALDKLSEENAALRSDVAALKAQLAALDQALTARGRDAGGVAFVLAVGNLGGALATARPFAAELTALDALAAKDPQLAAQVKELTAPLADRAAVGVPTLVELQSRFPAIARAIVDAARQPAPAPVENTESQSWYERPLGWLSSAGEWLSSQVSVRPVGEVAGDDAGARVARAEVRLSQNDLAAAVKELEGLSEPPAAAAAATWLGDARARLAVDRVVSALQAAAVTRLGSSAANTGGAGG
jgi:uroporphyrinogen-III synthase